MIVGKVIAPGRIVGYPFVAVKCIAIKLVVEYESPGLVLAEVSIFWKDDLRP